MRPMTRLLLEGPLRALLILGVLAAPASAGAEDIAAAEALFNKGVEDMNARHYDTGCKAIAESQRIDPRPGTLYTLATCEAAWGRIATAVTRYGDFIALYDRLPDAQKTPVQAGRYKDATEKRAKLLPDVPQLTLSLPKEAPAGTIVKRDGEVVGDAAFGVALPVDPGEHTLSVQVPGGAVQEQRIKIEKGEKKEVTLTLPESAPPESTATATPTAMPLPALTATTTATATATPEVPRSGASRSYAGPIVAFAAGAVGLGLGVGLGVTVLGKRSELDKACPGHGCPVSEQGRLDEAKTLSYVSTAGFVLAGVGAAAGAMLLLLATPEVNRPKKVSARLGVGYLGVEGSF